MTYEDWREELTEWLEDHDYRDPEVSTEPVAAWFRQLASLYRPLWETEDGARYFVGETGVHVAFSVENDELAIGVAEKWARCFGLGYQLFQHSGQSIFVPSGQGGYRELRTVHPDRVGWRPD
ncbi:MAG: hypothetical protein KF842_00835 [Caulobacter sp.]|nr:hypothetical protein [Caulobacter sp.]